MQAHLTAKTQTRRGGGDGTSETEIRGEGQQEGGKSIRNDVCSIMSFLIVQISSSLAHTRPSKTSLCIFTCLPNIQLKAFTMEQNPFPLPSLTWAWLPLLLTSVSSYPLLQTKGGRGGKKAFRCFTEGK